MLPDCFSFPSSLPQLTDEQKSKFSPQQLSYLQRPREKELSEIRCPVLGVLSR
jgi:hypothetical protein